MSWVQVKSPNLNVQTSMGMCLKYVQDAFGSGWAGSYALQGWRDIVKKKHANRNIPAGVYVPIWFEGYWNGINYGHVAIYKDGVCWSSPYTNKRTHDRLGNIETVERVYGMKYIGWSEDIGGTTVIKKGGIMRKIQNAPNWRWRMQRLHWQLVGNWDMSEPVFKSIVGKDPWTVVENWSDHQNANKAMEYQKVGQMAVQDKWQKQVYDLQAKVAELGKRPTQAQLNELKGQMDKISSDMKNAQAEAAQARRDLADNAKQQQAIKDEANNFLTALINAVRKMFGK